ncbi:MAG: bifunctional oligoribonuclease/PAP phosphatase NrnA [Clostridia bacterium]|nr:bifunctional oligoribonuclease/PAP phosphatase NrnA [Clostridia bacterium]
MIENIVELIKKYDTIIIHRHKKPDGDALGSQIGLKNIILDNFEGKTVYVVGDHAGRYAFMDGSEMDEIADECYNGALAFVLDTSAKSLISDDRYTLADATVRMDHHIFVEKICDTELTDTSYESCCGLITDFADRAGLKLSSASAKALYTGMVTDSGRFRYDSTTSNTHRLASILMKEDFSTADIYRGLYSDGFENVRMRAQFVMKIEFTEAGVAYIYTTKDEVKALGVDTFTISRGMVGTMSEIKGVDIWANFTETEEGILCELRSSMYNINRIAVKYGGGGHEKASGATLKSRDEVDAMLNDLDAIIKENA